MNLAIDATAQTLTYQIDGKSETLDLYSKEAFELLSRWWVKVGWQQKYSYGFTWMGRPIIQLPEDMVRIQEVLYQVKPDVIIETGVAHGGSLIFYASLCKVLEKGRVIGVDITIRPHNRAAIEKHELASWITLVEGSSTDEGVLREIDALIQPGERVLVILDSCHTKAHVAAELEAYHPWVSQGSYIVVTDGIMHDLFDVPGGDPQWEWDHPMAAAREFAERHPEFLLAQPEWLFNESPLSKNITYWPGAYLQRK